MFAASHIYAWDIETDTKINGLDPRVARITEISLSTADNDLVFDNNDEAALIEEFDEALSELPPGLLTDWNGTFFDLGFVHERAKLVGPRRLGLQLIEAPGLQPKYQLLPGHHTGFTAIWNRRDGLPHQHLDIMFSYKQWAGDNDVKHSLKPVGLAHGIDMIEVDRDKMHLLTPEERRAYATSDTRGTRELAIRKLGAA